jgi:acyl carrier protein
VTAELEKVEAFVKGKHPTLAELDPDTDLIENRLIDSLSFIEFVFLIEQLSGQSIPLETVNVDDFRTLNTIGRRFFGVAAP